jgi:predicted regulator of Ras-like GTPase activity (Roadblock/LC7/MglB family)
MLLADMLVADKDVPKAIANLRQVLAIKPNDPAATAKIAELEKAHGIAPAAAASTPAMSNVGGEPLMPFQGPMTTAIKAATGSRTATLDALCAEPGVRGALVVDMHGRVVVTKNLAAGQDELLAALSAEVARSAQASLSVIGIDKLSTWALTAGAGQVLTFQRDRAFSVVILADVTVRPAMLELRARQTLIDLGAA